MPRNRFLPRFTIVGLAGCAAGPTTVAFPAAFARAWCAPTDGPAVAVELSESAKSAPLTPPLVRVYVYQSRSSAAGKTWSLATPYTEGNASHCSSETACETATRGTVRFDPTSSADILSGTLDVIFPTKGAVQGPFRATWQTTQTLCG